MPGWSKRDIDDFITARSAGGGIWECRGSVIALGTGRTLANLHGIEEVKVSSPFRRLPKPSASSPQRVVHLTPSTSPRRDAPRETHAATLHVRTTLFYTSPQSHTPLKTYRFRPTTPKRAVYPILPAAGAVRVALGEGGSLVLTRTRGREDGAAAVVEEAPKRTRGLLSAGWAFVGRSAAAKPGVITPAVVERYEYAVDRRGGIWSWARVGRCPAWYGRGQCVSYLSARRVDGGWNGVDEKVKAWMRGEGRDRPMQREEVEEAEREEEKRRAVEAKKRRRILGIF